MFSSRLQIQTSYLSTTFLGTPGISSVFTCGVPIFMESRYYRFIFLVDFSVRTKRQRYSRSEVYSMVMCDVVSLYHWVVLCLWGDREADWGTWPCRASRSPPVGSSPDQSWWERSPTPAQLCPGPTGCSAEPRSHPEPQNHYKSQKPKSGSWKSTESNDTVFR